MTDIFSRSVAVACFCRGILPNRIPYSYMLRWIYYLIGYNPTEEFHENED